MKQRISGIQKIYREGIRRLKEAGIEDASIDAWMLLEYATGISRASFYAHTDMELKEETEERYFACIDRRTQHIPLQHITEEQEFMGYSFYVNEHVLIPRQDTEILVEEALKVVTHGMKILDMCTGSGCVMLSILKAGREKLLLEELSGLGIDISEEALKAASRNARELLGDSWQEKYGSGLFCCSNLFEEVEGEFDLIVSNPPYIRTSVIEELQEEVRLHDPYIALDGREDGLYFYREIIKGSIEHISDGGYLLFEIGHDQAEEVSALMQLAGYSAIYVKKDLAGLDRVVGGRYNRD